MSICECVCLCIDWFVSCRFVCKCDYLIWYFIAYEFGYLFICFCEIEVMVLHFRLRFMVPYCRYDLWSWWLSLICLITSFTLGWLWVCSGRVHMRGYVILIGIFKAIDYERSIAEYMRAIGFYWLSQVRKKLIMSSRFVLLKDLSRISLFITESSEGRLIYGIYIFFFFAVFIILILLNYYR
jgi:hypothetical protein